MKNEIATNDNAMREFHERVIEKLRKDIGEMLPDSVLQQMVAKAVGDNFFKPIPEVRDRYGHITEQSRASWFAQAVAEQAKPIIEQAVKDLLERERESIKKAIDDFLSQQNLLLITIGILQAQTSFDIQNGMRMLLEQIRRPID